VRFGPTFGILAHFQILLRLWRVVNSVTVRCGQPGVVNRVRLLQVANTPHCSLFTALSNKVTFCHIRLLRPFLVVVLLLLL